MDSGKKLYSGGPKEVIGRYTQLLQSKSSTKEEVDYKKDNCKPDREIKYTFIEGKEGRRESEKWRDYRIDALRESKKGNKIIIERFNERESSKESYGGEKAKIVDATLSDENNCMNMESIIGGEVVKLEVDVAVVEDIRNVIAGFIVKNDKGLTLFGDNTLNSIPSHRIQFAKAGKNIKATFIFTIPMLPRGEYSICLSIAEGTQNNHTICHWINDAIIIRSLNTTIYAGMAGIPMHSIALDLHD